MPLKIILLLALGFLTAIFTGGFLDAGATDIVKKILFGGASAVMILLTILIMFFDNKPEEGENNMNTRTERTDEMFWTVILFVVTATLYFLAYVLFADGKMGFAYPAVAMAIIGTISTFIGIREILMRRWAEMMKKGKEPNK